MTTPTINLVLSPGACSLASHILLQETGHLFTTTSFSVRNGAPESLRAINPKMRVPVLLLSPNITITETPAILTAISQLAPGKYLMGKPGLETVRVYEWLNWLSGTLHGQAFGALLRPARFSSSESMYPTIQAKGKKSVEECFDVIENDLKGLHAVGDDFTAVDAFLYVFWRWGAGDLDMKGRYPKWNALVGELVKREGVRKALEEEGIESFVVDV
jgi:glutathione S-transferase